MNKIKLLSFQSITIVLILFIAGFLISFKDLNTLLINGDMDGYARAKWSYDVYNSRQMFNLSETGGPWLPLHPRILALGYYIIKNPLIAPRLITLIFNTFSIPIIFFYTKRIFRNHDKDNAISILATLLYLICPIRIGLATQPLSEPISMFFLLLVLFLFVSEKIDSVYAIVFINIAQAIRFEFWYLLPIIWIILWQKYSNNIRKLLIYCLLTMTFPVYWMILCFVQSGNFLSFFSIVYSTAQSIKPEIPYNHFMYATMGWFKILGQLIGLSGIILYIYSVYKLLNSKTLNIPRVLIYATIPLFFLYLLIMQVFLGVREWLGPRHLFSVLVTMIPFVSYGAIEICTDISKRIHLRYVLGLLFFIFISFDMIHIANYSQNLKQIVPSLQISQMANFVHFYKNTYDNNQLITYVNDHDWIIPMFEYLTQNHNITEITSSQYKYFQPKPGEMVILSKNLSVISVCKGNLIYKNTLVEACIN
jgi:hypothetical protein